LAKRTPRGEEVGIGIREGNFRSKN